MNGTSSLTKRPSRSRSIPASACRDTRAVSLGFIPDAVKLVKIQREMFWRETHHIYPNRILMTETFASCLCRELARAMGVAVPLGEKPIVKPGTTVMNMRVHVVPDDCMALPCEVSFAQELRLPGYDRQYMTNEQSALARMELNGYTVHDFSGFMLENKS